MSEDRNPWAEIAFLASPPASCYSATVKVRMEQHGPPYRATNFGKGPYVVIGSPGFNMLGVLFHNEDDAQWAADVMNRAAKSARAD